jgi:hypothetical protein
MINVWQQKKKNKTNQKTQKSFGPKKEIYLVGFSSKV